MHLWEWQDLFQYREAFYAGLKTTLMASGLALLFSLVIGLALGIMQAARLRVITQPIRLYIEFFQNTPLLVQAFFVYHGLPRVGVKLDAFWVGVVCLTLYAGAYMAEIVRAGIVAVPRGQVEAALAQGMTFLQAMVYIILPQAQRVMLPPLANQAQALVKNSAVLGIIAGGDLMYHADVVMGNSFIVLPTYTLIAALYFAICFPLTRWIAFLERRATLIQ